MVGEDFAAIHRFQEPVLLDSVLEASPALDHVSVSPTRSYVIYEQEVLDVYARTEDDAPIAEYVIELCTSSRSKIENESDWESLTSSLTSHLDSAFERSSR